MAKKENRLVVTLACGECKERNYTTEKNKKNDSARLEMKKYCRRCHRHTIHRETK
jgi:large subunit ribosomal protein L33